MKDDITFRVQSTDRVFCVRLVREGVTYGRDRCLTHAKEDPLVEFYDTKYAGKKGFDPLGQFVSRYYLSTLQGRDHRLGLALHGREPAWSVPARAMTYVMQWLKLETDQT